VGAGPLRSVSLSAAALEEIRRAAAASYPHEGCGALLGPGYAEITATLPITNREEEKPRVRFAISPRDYMAVEAEADRRGQVLVGFWHSHPDHPARPSETDRRYAWEGLLTAVIAVERGQPKALTAWEVTGPDGPFQEVALNLQQGD